MKKASLLLSGILGLGLLSACSSVSSVVEMWVPVPQVESAPIGASFTVEGVTFPTNPDTYEEIVSMVETMVESHILRIDVPYSGDFMTEELYEMYQRAYGEAYSQVNTTHIEYTCNTSRYEVGYRVTATGEHLIHLALSDGDFSDSEILYQQMTFQEKIATLVEDLWLEGRLTAEMSEMDLLREVYLFVTEYLDYSYEITPDSFTGYGAVTNKRAVCQGYVAMFNAMVKYLGFEAEGVSGVVGVGMFAMDEGHIWSRVKVGERWVTVDTTFADRHTFQAGEGDLSYNMDYFDMSDDFIMRDRSTQSFGINNAVLQG